MTSHLYLDTRNSNGTENYNTSWNIYNQRLQLMDNFMITLRNIEFPNTVYPINEYNNVISITEDQITEGTLTITPGVYTGSTYASTIETALNALRDNDVNINDTYTVSYDTVLKVLTISSTGTFSFVVTTNSAYESMGLDESTFTALQNSWTSVFPINISGTQYVDVVSNLASLSYSAASTSHVLARVPIDVAFGGIVFYQSQFHEKLDLTSHHIDIINLTLLDDHGNLFKLPRNSHVSLVLSIIPS